MGKKSNLMHQAIKQLNKQKKFGESKFDAKKAARQSGESTAVRGIYSTATYNSYVKVCKQFITETLANHREVKNFADCRQYVAEFLQAKEEQGVSAWTLDRKSTRLNSSH